MPELRQGSLRARRRRLPLPALPVGPGEALQLHCSTLSPHSLPGGQYAAPSWFAQSGARACSDCPQGKFAETPGASKCGKGTACAAGHRSRCRFCAASCSILGLALLRLVSCSIARASLCRALRLRSIECSECLAESERLRLPCAVRVRSASAQCAARASHCNRDFNSADKMSCGARGGESARCSRHGSHTHTAADPILVLALTLPWPSPQTSG